MIKQWLNPSLNLASFPLQFLCSRAVMSSLLTVAFESRIFTKILWHFCKEWEISTSWCVHFWEMSLKEQAVVGIAMELAGDDPDAQDNADWCRFILWHSHLDSSTGSAILVALLKFSNKSFLQRLFLTLLLCLQLGFPHQFSSLLTSWYTLDFT